MRHLDLFSGIGGFALGLEATRRIKTVAFCEIDKYCTKVLNKNWPGVPVYNDIRELTYDRLKTDEIGPIDIITGGYPCQPFSIAGSKKGVEDPRHLWPEYFRLIKECRPTWIIGENVSGHIKLGLDAVQEDLESQGYSLRTFSVSASSIGANHQRERIWTVAYSQRNYDSQQIKRVNGEESSLQKEHRENDSTTRNFSGASAIRETRNEHADVEDARRRSWREQFTWNTESTGRGTSEKTEWSTNTDTSPGPSEGTETMANPNSNGLERRLSEVSNKTNAREDTSELGRKSSSEIIRQGNDGGNRKESRINENISGSSNRAERTSSSSTRIRNVSSKSNDNQDISGQDFIKENNDRTLVQERQGGVQSSKRRGLEHDQAFLRGSDVRQGNDNINKQRVDNVANSESIGSRKPTEQEGRESFEGRGEEESTRSWWHTEPDVGRVADGIPDRTHRLKALGNAVVPQIPYYIAKSILEVMDA